MEKQEINGAEYLGEHEGHQLFRNNMGEIEDYKSTGLQNVKLYCRPAKSVKRIVTKFTTVGEWCAWVAEQKENKKDERVIKHDHRKDNKQIKIIFKYEDK